VKRFAVLNLLPDSGQACKRLVKDTHLNLADCTGLYVNVHTPVHEARDNFETMLVTFTTKTYSDITMFGDIALDLLKRMGHSATVPGAVKADANVMWK